MHKRLLLLVVTFFVFCSRLPFLGAGYGNDPDAWQMANVARQIAETGEYTASRLPGYPLPELTYSALYLLIGKENPFIFNCVTALMSASAFLIFSLILKKFRAKDYILGGLALVFTPVIFINSTNSMDYVWALTFILASTFFILSDKTLIGAVFLGFAIGSRITSGVMLLPLAFLIIQQGEKDNFRTIVSFFSAACLIGALFFVPVFLRYGSGFLTSTGNYPPFLWIVYSASVGVWGAIGSIILLLIIATQLGTLVRHVVNTIRSNNNNANSDEPIYIISVSIVLLYFIAFLILPHDGSYLIPIVPFVILILHRFLPRARFVFLCLAIILSSFLLTVEKDKIALVGPVFNDNQERLEKTTYVERYLSIAESLDHESLIIAGPWLPQIVTMLPEDPSQLVEYVYLIEESALQPYLDSGYWVYYLSSQRELTIDYHGYDLEDKGASPLVPGEKQGVKW